MSLNVYEIMLIAWVQARFSMNKNFSIQNAVTAFLKFYEIPEHCWNTNTALQFVYNNLGADLEMRFENLTKKIEDYGI